MDTSPITLINGNVFADDRGLLRFCNDFDFRSIKRFYQVENFEIDTIRAFHGHMKEGKYVYVPCGSALLCAVHMDSTATPNKANPVQRVVLTDRKPQIAWIPPAHANGFKALEPNTKILFFSTSTLEESKGDDFRFPHDYWGAEIWKVEYR